MLNDIYDRLHTREIAAYGGIPVKSVEQIMHDLRAARLVTSVRGRAGGYILAYGPEEITIADIVDATEGSRTAPGGRKRGADAADEERAEGIGDVGDVVHRRARRQERVGRRHRGVRHLRLCD